MKNMLHNSQSPIFYSHHKRWALWYVLHALNSNYFISRKKKKIRSQSIPEACRLCSKPLVQLYRQVVTDHEHMAEEPFKS